MSSLKPMDRKCRFCGKTLPVDDNLFDFAAMDRTNSLGWACCTECYERKDGIQKRRHILKVLSQAMSFLERSRSTLKDGDPARIEAEKMTHRELVRSTKLYAELLTKETGQPNRWTPDLVDEIMHSPSRFEELIKTHPYSKL